MKYTEIVGDLFQVSPDYFLVHCISADFALGKGIAVEFNKYFDMKNRLCREYTVNGKYPNCLKVDRVFNLVTKEKYWQKPTYETLTLALLKMKEQCLLYGIKKIAMPLIGCGLDRLEWNRTSQILQDIFSDMDIEILVVKKV